MFLIIFTSSPNSSQTHPPSLHIKLVSLLFNPSRSIHTVQICLHVLPSTARGYLSLPATGAYQWLHSQWWDCVANAPLHVGIWAGLAYPGLMHAATTTVSSYVKLPFCVQKIMFACSHQLPLALIPCLTLFCNDCGALGVVLRFKVEHSAVSYPLHNSLIWVTVLNTIYCKQKLLR